MAIDWIAAGLLADNMPIAMQNMAMLLVNAWGVWQYLLNPRKKKEIERLEELEEQAHEEVEREEGEKSPTAGSTP